MNFHILNIVATLCLVNKHYRLVKDASDANCFKMHTKMVLKLDVSPKRITNEQILRIRYNFYR